MRFLALNKIILVAIAAFFYSGVASAQEGNVRISKDPKIDKLLTFQKEINEDTDNDTRLKIQIFNGNLRNAQRVKSQFEMKYRDVPVNIKFETPNYKVWVGNFRTSLEADRYLVYVQRSFPNAFIFSPKKKK